MFLQCNRLNSLGGKSRIDKVQQAIIESIDLALDRTISDKDEFYVILKEKYGLKREDIPTNYGVFHEALTEIYGLNHHKIDREIIRALHSLAENGTYRLIDEIPAFITIVENHIEEANRLVEKAKQRF